MAAIIEAVSQAALTWKSKDGKWPSPVAFPVRIASSTRAWTRCAASMYAFWPSHPFVLAGRFVARRLYRHPVLGLEQGELGAWMRSLPAGEDAHFLRPALELVPAGTFAQQPGQLGDVRFLDPAAAVRAAGVRAGIIGALADLAAAVDGDLPGFLRDQAQRRLLPLGQHPPGRVDHLIAGAGGELVQVRDQVVAGAGPVHGDHQPAPEAGRQRRDRRVHQGDVVRGGVAAAEPRRSSQASGSPPVLSPHPPAAGDARIP